MLRYYLSIQRVARNKGLILRYYLSIQRVARNKGQGADVKVLPEHTEGSQE